MFWLRRNPSAKPPRAVGDAAGARDQFAALLPLSEQVHGTDHPATMTARHQLAYWTEELRGEETSAAALASHLTSRNRDTDAAWPRLR